VLRNEHFVAGFKVLTIIASKYFKLKTMDEHTYSNWVKVKETFESSGNTDNFFYKRACAIVSGKPDPMDNVKPSYGAPNDGTET
jgi:hypothetical protein